MHGAGDATGADVHDSPLDLVMRARRTRPHRRGKTARDHTTTARGPSCLSRTPDIACGPLAFRFRARMHMFPSCSPRNRTSSRLLQAARRRSSGKGCERLSARCSSSFDDLEDARAPTQGRRAPGRPRHATSCSERLNRTFITPLEREDIHDLASGLDDVLDAVEAIGSRHRAVQDRRRRRPTLRSSPSILVECGGADRAGASTASRTSRT